MVDSALSDRRLLVVRNREPYERRRRMDGLRNRVIAADSEGWVEDPFASVATTDREEAHVGDATYAAVD